MAIKINGIEVIDDNKKGKFQQVNPGVYTITERDALSPAVGDIIYNSDDEGIQAWNGAEWAAIGLSAGPLNAAIPPLLSMSGPEMELTNLDNKIEFSLDAETWSSNLTIPSETSFYVNWTDDILSAPHDSNYDTIVYINYPNLSTNQEVDLNLKIDKLPDPFTLEAETGTILSYTYTSNTISPLSSINAPTAIWGSSTAINPEIAIGAGDFEPLPTTINTRYVNLNQRIRVRHTTGELTNTNYSTIINIGYGENSGEFKTSSFSTTTTTVLYDVPTLTSDSGADVRTSAATFTLSAPSGSDINHASTTWQISPFSDFSVITQESVEDSSNLLSYSFSGLSENDVYYARARFVDASNSMVVSPWATAGPVTARVAGYAATFPANSALDIKADNPNKPSGEYYFNTPSGVKKLKADMTTDGGGWTQYARTESSNDTSFDLATDYGISNESPAGKFCIVSYKDTRDIVSDTGECEILVSMSNNAYQIKMSTLYQKGENDYTNASYEYFNGAGTLNSYFPIDDANSIPVQSMQGDYPDGNPTYTLGFGGECKRMEITQRYSPLYWGQFGYANSGPGGPCSGWCGRPGALAPNHIVIPYMQTSYNCYENNGDDYNGGPGVTSQTNTGGIEVYFREKQSAS